MRSQSLQTYLGTRQLVQQVRFQLLHLPLIGHDAFHQLHSFRLQLLYESFTATDTPVCLYTSHPMAPATFTSFTNDFCSCMPAGLSTETHSLTLLFRFCLSHMQKSKQKWYKFILLISTGWPNKNCTF